MIATKQEGARFGRFFVAACEDPDVVDLAEARIIAQMAMEMPDVPDPLGISVTFSLKEAIAEAASQVDPNPSEEQKTAGNYRKGHVTVQGLPITIENAKGSIRSGKCKDGTEWSVTMASHYGYIKRTESEADGDHIDVFLGPDPESEIVFIIDQVKESGKFDEHKCMIGFTTQAAAKEGYLANYSKGWTGLGGIKPMTMPEFKEWIHGDATGEPVALSVSDGEKLCKFSSTQFNIDQCGYTRTQGMPGPKLQKMADRIPDDALAEDGREAEFHVTIKYGLHTNSPEEVRKVVEGFSGVNMTLGETSVFEGKEHDVVKISVDSADLHRLNALIAEKLECTDTFPDYKPHITLAYVKKGRGKDFAGWDDAKGHSICCHRLVFSSQDKERTTIDLLPREMQHKPFPWEMVKPGEPDAALSANDDGEWITIGGHEEGDKKHVGGFRVLIKDGVIVKGGPKGLRGKKVSEVKAYFDGAGEKEQPEVAAPKPPEEPTAETKPPEPERKKVKVRKSPDRSTHGVTLAREIISRGGINPASLEEFVGKGMIGEEGLLGVAKKGARSVDDLAQELEAEGHFQTPPGKNSDDHLVDLLRQGAHSIVNAADHVHKQAEQEYDDYLRQARDAGIAQGDIAEATRSGEEESDSEATQGDAWESPGAAADDEGLESEDKSKPQDDDIPFSIDAAFNHGDSSLKDDIFNPQAQAILEKAMAQAATLSADARAALGEVLAIENPAELADALIQCIERYRIQLAELLTKSQVAALLEGAREVAEKIPPLPPAGYQAPLPPTIAPEEAEVLLERLYAMPEMERALDLYKRPAPEQNYLNAMLRLGIRPPAKPPEAPPLSPPGDESDWPIIDEAVRSLSQRNVIDRYGFDQLDAAARQKAFTVTGIASEEALAKVRDLLAESVNEGSDYKAFRKTVLAEVEESTYLSEPRLQTIFRTNIQTAYSDGTAKVTNMPFVRSAFPYAAYHCIHDDRARKNHKRLEKLGIDGTNIYRIDDPVFQMFRPPWDYNDRCGWNPLTVRQAAEQGLKEAILWLETGMEPAPTYVAMPDFRPPAGFDRSPNAVPLSIQLSHQSLVTAGGEGGKLVTDSYAAMFKVFADSEGVRLALGGAFNDAMHPRGNTKNAGQFSKKGETAVKPQPSAAPKQEQPAQQPAPQTPQPEAAQGAKHAQHEPAKGMLAKLQALEHAAAEWVDKQVGRLPGPIQKPVRMVWAAMMASYTTAAKMVEEVAAERGATPDQVKRITAIATAADYIAGGKGMPMLAKALGASGLGVTGAGFVPVGSLAYLGYSAARNPVKTMRGARRAIKMLIAGKQQQQQVAMSFSLECAIRGEAMPTKEAISRLMDHMQGPQADEFEALVYAAIDETGGDLDAAIDLARMALQQPDAKFSDESQGQWITIGGKTEGGEQHKGGFPVFIDKAGTILKGGPKGLRGKKVGETKAFFDGQTEKASPSKKPAAAASGDRPFAKVEPEKAERPFAPPEIQTAAEIPDEKPAPKKAVPKAASEVTADDNEWATEQVEEGTPESLTSHFTDEPHGDGLSRRLDQLYDIIQSEVPAITTSKWKAFLQKAWDAKVVELQGINEVRKVQESGGMDKVLVKSDHGLDRVLAFAIVKDPKKLQQLIQADLLGKNS